MKDKVEVPRDDIVKIIEAFKHEALLSMRLASSGAGDLSVMVIRSPIHSFYQGP